MTQTEEESKESLRIFFDSIVYDLRKQKVKKPREEILLGLKTWKRVLEVGVKETIELERSQKFYFRQINPYWFFKLEYPHEVVHASLKENLRLNKQQVDKFLQSKDFKADDTLYSEIKSNFARISGFNSKVRV